METAKFKNNFLSFTKGFLCSLEVVFAFFEKVNALNGWWEKPFLNKLRCCKKNLLSCCFAPSLRFTGGWNCALCSLVYLLQTIWWKCIILLFFQNSLQIHLTKYNLWQLLSHATAISPSMKCSPFLIVASLLERSVHAMVTTFFVPLWNNLRDL